MSELSLELIIYKKQHIGILQIKNIFKLIYLQKFYLGSGTLNLNYFKKFTS